MSAPQPPTPAASNDELHCCAAYFMTARRRGHTVVTVSGEIDASNAERFAAYALTRSAPGRRLTVDLTRLKFFGVEGFTALHTINTGCAAKGARWGLLPGAAVSRVLSICDPVGALPITRPPAASLQLVP